MSTNKPSVPEMAKCVFTQGNVLSKKERQHRLKQLTKEIGRGWVDKEIIPYLERINSFSFLVTTQSCCGHNENPKDGRRAHVDFRSMLSEKETINKILRPLDMKRNPPDIATQLMVESYGVRYCLWLPNNRWRDALEDFITVLSNVA